MEDVVHIKGGSCIGWVHSSPPLTMLSFSKERLEIDTLLIGRYRFYAEEIIKIEPVTYIPIILTGIKIHHTVASYPERILFLSISKPDDVIHKITNIGFVGTGLQSDRNNLNKRERPVKILSIITVIILWNILFLMGILNFFDNPSIKTLISPWVIIAFSMVFTLSIAIKSNNLIAKIFLKPKRHINEILPYINLLMIISGPAIFFMSILKLFMK